MSSKAALTDKHANDSSKSRLTEESMTTRNGLRVTTRYRVDADDSVYSETLLQPGESQNDKSQFRKNLEEKIQNAIFINDREDGENAVRDVDDLLSEGQTTENIDDLKFIWSEVSDYGTDNRYDHMERYSKWYEYKAKLNASLAMGGTSTTNRRRRKRPIKSGTRRRSRRRSTNAGASESQTSTYNEVETAAKGEIDTIVSLLGKEKALSQVSLAEDDTSRSISSAAIDQLMNTLMTTEASDCTTAKSKIDAMIKVFGKEWTGSLVSTAKQSTKGQLADTVTAFSKSWNEPTARAARERARWEQTETSNERAPLTLTAAA
ncbi:hypothetical protein I302_108609 [Kwoniella bestiolae CBS 10118]|uniref:Uncharacterized protein n=1 Tax=Kwoniella bestiolae CBS 10118 TaxID=1296100 RepID=A0A1B9FTK5_9TREE|nr:hypothetical protein I302_07747 [Kwoniella bestiolae CBS 10118]OCF22105.1 hypothetical protein I302_07747 [Kwoniella bestiolae CBS 10118]